MTEEQIGIFLGAGASFELGMPLVWHLTGEFKGYFTPKHLMELNVGWRQQGGGYDDSVIDAIIGVMQRNYLHYENILGFLQTLYSRPNQLFADQYNGMYQRMVEAVYLILYHRQAKSLSYIRRGFPPFEGLAELSAKSYPIWVFSLNHDLMIELLAHHCGIPLRDGFWPEQVLSISNEQSNGCKKTFLEADILSEADLESGNLHFFNIRQPGINLFKLHGALDVFAFRNGLDLCRLRPTDNSLDGRLKALRILNEEIGYWVGGQKMRVVNEIACADSAGAVQFLRRSLLAGARKFDKRMSQTLPQKMMVLFRSYINHVRNLYVIGYSFNDEHVNVVLRDWLEFSGARLMVVIDPSCRNIPHSFAHVAPQIEVRQQSASEFFTAYRSNPLTRSQRFDQYVRKVIRPYGERKAAKKW